jgi:hypothetical protein
VEDKLAHKQIEMFKADANAILEVIPESRWLGAQMARCQIAIQRGDPIDKAARQLYEQGSLSLTKARQTAVALQTQPLESLLTPRAKTGSAENPVTKLFPAAITERQFVEVLDLLCAQRPSVSYRDERTQGHTLFDFVLRETDIDIPVNVKNAGTRFQNAANLVGLDPDDCIPIPAYKAYDAVERVPNLLYAVCINYDLLAKIHSNLLPLLTPSEAHVWALLNEYSGTLIRDAEDRFVYSTVSKYWSQFTASTEQPDFRIVSARKAIRILQTVPKRTPGLGLRAWGTGASAEVNVHLSVREETKSWIEIQNRIHASGLGDIASAVNRKRTEIVFDPEF